MLNDIIDIKLQQVESKREKEKAETESEDSQRKYEGLRETLVRTELQLRDLQENKLIIQKELESKRKDEEAAVFSCKQLKEENDSQKVDIVEMKKLQEQELKEQKSNLQGKDDIIRELTLRIEAQQEQQQKNLKDSANNDEAKKHLEEELRVKEEKISMLKISYNQSKKELAGMKSYLEDLEGDNYFLIYMICVLLFVIASLI